MVIKASTMVNLSFRTLARGAKQLVVHEALPVVGQIASDPPVITH